MKTAVYMIALVLQAPVSLMRGVLSLIDDVLRLFEGWFTKVQEWSEFQNNEGNGYEA